MGLENPADILLSIHSLRLRLQAALKQTAEGISELIALVIIEKAWLPRFVIAVVAFRNVSRQS